MNRKPYAILPLLWILVMLVLTLTPAQDMPRTPEWKFLSFDTAAHAGVFAVLAGLSWFSLRRQRRWPRLAAHAGAVVLVGCVLFGGLIEVLQYAMHLGRHAEWTDLVGDSVGAALALLLVASIRRWRQRQAGLALLALVLATSAAHAQTEPDMTRARGTIETLAAPAMHGRGYVQGGEHLAAAYLRGRLKQLGLQPLAPNYTQPFGLDMNTFPGKVALRITSLGEDAPLDFQPLRLGIDFIVAPESGGTAKLLNSKFVRFDTLAFTDEVARQRLQRVMRYTYPPEFPAKSGLFLTAKEEQRLKQLPAGVQQTLDSAAVRLVLVPKLTASLASEQLPTVRVEAVATQPLLAEYSRLRYGLARNGFAAQIQLDAQLLRNYQTQNLAAVVRGRIQPDSFLVVTAHYDHLGMMGKTTYFPGANDNASGVALLLELAAHYARPENRPACSVVFLLFGAEEAGLVGSSYFVQHPLVPLKNIRFLVNLDLLGTGEEGATVVNGKVFPAAFQQLTALNDAHHYLPRLTARGAAANSDHYPFSQLGVPAFFLYTRGGSLAYHDVNDRPAALSLVGFAGAFGLVRDFLQAQDK
ncbi:MAG: VanZ family protein [Janthinobacterium lividum]